MFENYWVLRYQGRAFSQYTPGWPLFMAPFDRAHVVWLAGPVMAGIAAVGVARLSRRLASGLGGSAESSTRIVRLAGPLGAAFAMLGPSMLLNGSSRFSHTMVAACFAWAVESMAVVSERSISRTTAAWYGAILGASTSLGVATRPADGAMLGVGVFLYFVWALVRRRVRLAAFVGTAITFTFFAGLVLLILHAQLTGWFRTGYTIVASIHPEAVVRLSWPAPNQIKYPIPLATGSYCWWPAAPALGIAGLVRALGGRERRIPFMMVLGALSLVGFYFFVEFGRGGDDGLGPRYILPVVVMMAAGGAGIVAPMVDAVRTRRRTLAPRKRSTLPALVVGLAVVYGVTAIAPLMYPVAYSEYRYATTPQRLARKLKNAIVAIVPGRVVEHETNGAQNPPMNPNPDVLFLIRRTDADEICAREHFPGRTWYRAGYAESLEPY